MSPYAEYVVLPLLKDLVRRNGRPIRAGLLAELLGKNRRTVYDYLRQIERAHKAARSPGGRLWVVQG